MDQRLLKELKETYHLVFHNEALLEQAFTHSSYVNEHRYLQLSDNERLEFLGDAVLELLVSQFFQSTRRKINETTSGDCL